MAGADLAVPSRTHTLHPSVPASPGWIVVVVDLFQIIATFSLAVVAGVAIALATRPLDRKSTRLNSSHRT